jgi:phage recombination protein Bet
MSNELQLSEQGFSPEKIELMKKTLCKGCTDEEFQLFLHACMRSGLDPFMKQIYAIKRGNQLTIQTAIDGFRLIADRTGNYSPGRECTYVYDEKGAVLEATAYIKKRTSDGVWHEVSASAHFTEYAQVFNGKLSGLWASKPRIMLAKCAESLALRKAFPADLSGLYTSDEMNQADIPIAEAKVTTYINKDQVRILDEMLEFDEDYRVKIMKGLAKMGVESLADIPTDMFDRVFSAVSIETDKLKLKEEQAIMEAVDDSF